MPAGLIALAIGGFGIGLTEFVITGLLPEIASDFGVSEASAGWLVTGYALAVMVGAIGVTAATIRLPRKTVLVGLVVLFIAGNLLSAIGTTYGLTMTGRIVAALCHGAFFGIGSVVAANMVAPEKKGAAVAIMFTGLTASNVLGVPFGTFLGQALGWRSTFWAITAIGVISLIGIALLVPRSREGSPTSLRQEVTAFRSGQVWLSLSVTVLGFGGMFGAFTYMAFTLTEVTGYASSAVPWLLMLFGLGLFVGNWAGGKLVARSIDGTLIIVLAALTLLLAVFALIATRSVLSAVALVLMGALGFATVPPLQTRIMNYASSAPTLASGANIAAFNLGNALGAWIGGLTIAAGLGFTSPLWSGSLLTLVALAIMCVAATSAHRSRQSRESEVTRPHPALATTSAS